MRARRGRITALLDVPLAEADARAICVEHDRAA
jgi:hypothetical protein